jgi:hypothetical protein
MKKAKATAANSAIEAAGEDLRFETRALLVAL